MTRSQLAGRVTLLTAAVEADDGELTVSSSTIDAIASRVVELLAPATTVHLIDAAEVARRYGLSRSSVYLHATELGAVRLGPGPKARLRFDPNRVAEVLTSRSAGERSQMPEPQADKPHRRRRRKSQAGQRAGLLPIKEVK